MGLMNPNTIFKNYRIIDENFISGSDDKSFSMKAYIYETNADKLKEIIPQIRQVLETNGYKRSTIVCFLYTGKSNSFQ